MVELKELSEGLQEESELFEVQIIISMLVLALNIVVSSWNVKFYNLYLGHTLTIVESSVDCWPAVEQILHIDNITNSLQAIIVNRNRKGSDQFCLVVGLPW